MATKIVEDLASFLKRQEHGSLVDVLVELAGDHAGVKERLSRLQLADRPDKLASGFRKTLTAWRRSTKYFHYRAEAREFANGLHAWLDQVERELLPKDPAAALALFDAFIQSDSHWFDRADDSDGTIGDVVRSACVHWLQAAKCCESPSDEWPDRLLNLYQQDQYGARDGILRQANLLLDETGMRQLVGQLEDLLAKAITVRSIDQTLPHEVFKFSAALSLLSEALGDPDIRVKAVCSYSPEPNGLQKEDFVRAYLKAGRPLDALVWLEVTWSDRHESTRQRLLSDTLAILGRLEESAEIRRGIFERSLAVIHFHRLLEVLPQGLHAAAHERASQLAFSHDDAIVAAQLLLEIGDAQGAESKLLAAANVNGDLYGSLLPMAKLFLERNCPRGASVVYRALLTGILERGYAKAYGHAASYWRTLKQINAGADSLVPLVSQEAFEAGIRLKHARKASFWTEVAQKEH